MTKLSKAVTIAMTKYCFTNYPTKETKIVKNIKFEFLKLKYIILFGWFGATPDNT